MSPVSSPRAALRAATRAHHDRVDALFSGLQAGDRASYARFLRAQAAAHLPVEAALTQAGAGAVVSDWPARQRGDLLLADLDTLGIAPPEPAGAIGFAGEAAVLGGVYVLEGSRMGGALLRRDMPADWPATFFAPGASGAWRRLVALLDARLAHPEDVEAAAEAATCVFELFERSGRQFLAEDDRR